LQKPVFCGDVLVCEDNKINQEVIGSHLEQLGLNATIAANGKLGVEYAKERINNGIPFDLILMDINMPVMDGLKTTQKLISAGNQAPIIALTANAVSTDREKYLAQGMSDYLSKPFTSQELWVCLLKHLTPVKTNAGNITLDKPFPILKGAPLIKNNVLDEALGIAWTSGDARFYKRICKNFVNDNLDIISTLNSLIELKNVEELHRTAHSMKNAARMIGATKLADAARDIELALANGDISRLAAGQIAAFESAWLELLEALASVAEPPRTAKPEGSGCLDIKAATVLIDTLAPLLRAGYSESNNYIDQIWTVFSPLGEVCATLAEQVDEYEYDAAYETLLDIKSILEKTDVAYNTASCAQ